MKHLYAIPTWNCNLKCPHCFIENRLEIFNRDKFLEELNKFDGDITLFGGEPSLYLDRLYDVFNSNKESGISKIQSVSTNLINLPNNLIDVYKEIGYISTSWNPNRFIENNNYETWIKNCRSISKASIPYTIMITLTDSLFELEIEFLLELIKSWVQPGLEKIKFEHYIGEEATPEYFKRVDDWLCKLYEYWDIPVELEMCQRVCNWYYDCSEQYTLTPDGILHHECPHMSQFNTPVECLNCERVGICRPCRLQKYCSYPKKFSELVEYTKRSVVKLNV